MDVSEQMVQRHKHIACHTAPTRNFLMKYQKDMFRATYQADCTKVNYISLGRKMQCQFSAHASDSVLARQSGSMDTA